MHIYDFRNRWSGADGEAVLSKAEGLANRALAIDPDEVLPNHAVAVVARWRGNYDLAAAAIGKALSKSPDFASALFTRGEIFMATGRLLEAIGDFERAMRLDPGFTHQYLQFLGMSHFLLGNYETAALMFRERLLLARDTDVGRAWLASALGHTGEIAEAKKTWADLRQINPDFSFEARLERLPFVAPSYVDKIMGGLAKAGLPD
jgi:adenylate cyclase